MKMEIRHFKVCPHEDYMIVYMEIPREKKENTTPRINNCV